MGATDNRMQWILQAEELSAKSADAATYCTEYELCSEARIPGVFKYGDDMLLCGLLQEVDANGLYTYLLRVRHLEKTFEYNEANYSKGGYYFKEGLVGEIIAIFSVFFQARFYLKATYVGEMTPQSIRRRIDNKLLYKKTSDHTKAFNVEMFSESNRNWCKDDKLSAFFDSIRKIDSKYHQALIRSMHWYTEAVKEIAVDHEMFFIKMVSSIEALLKTEGDKKDALELKLRGLKTDFDGDEWHQIENWLTNRLIKKKFVNFIVQYSNGFTPLSPRKPESCHIAQDKIDDYSKRIYDARSTYLHVGEPMFLSMDYKGVAQSTWDLDPAMSMSVDRKRIDEKQKLPRVRWFERIVNFAIKKYIERLLVAN